VVIFPPLKLTVAPDLNPVPVMVTENAPVGIGTGLIAVIAGPAGSIFTYWTPSVLPSEATASTSVLTVGITAGDL
jgi:hypothetical protein